ncbi:hypothetical protein [Mesorhizobium huakuii]|uniref:Uncharacterized protein n=1 Tax=Mesorhizobium huakuii TaxID=28104 RepID=A0A7G6T165_9HYPH|nr:hypothetical protein [Mesorhizobium huakuii]QND60497.1 hypothetical protein HB778_31075 [Mesorhizobium huakuii]
MNMTLERSGRSSSDFPISITTKPLRHASTVMAHGLPVYIGRLVSQRADAALIVQALLAQTFSVRAACRRRQAGERVAIDYQVMSRSVHSTCSVRILNHRNGRISANIFRLPDPVPNPFDSHQRKTFVHWLEHLGVLLLARGTWKIH